jgi:hypothetical protein
MSKKVRVGEMFKTENLDKKKFSTEQPYYLAVMVKYKVDGKWKKRSLLFTKSEMDRAADRANKQVEGKLEQSLISKILD